MPYGARKNSMNEQRALGIKTLRADSPPQTVPQKMTIVDEVLSILLKEVEILEDGMELVLEYGEEEANKIDGSVQPEPSKLVDQLDVAINRIKGITRKVTGIKNRLQL